MRDDAWGAGGLMGLKGGQCGHIIILSNALSRAQNIKRKDEAKNLEHGCACKHFRCMGVRSGHGIWQQDRCGAYRC